MGIRQRKKRINFEVTDEMYADIHEIAKELNIPMRKYIWRLILPDIEKRKAVKVEKLEERK